MKTIDALLAILALLLGTGASSAATITIDGVNDFAPADTYSTSTAGQTGYATADGVNIYLGYDAPAVSSGSSNQWYLAYLGTGAVGTTSGATFNTQQPNLPFSGTHLLRWRADGAVADVLAWNGSSWAGSAATISLAQVGSYLEIGIPLIDLGGPTEIDLAAYMLSDQTSNEWSYGVMPGTAFSDNYDPNVTDFQHLAVPESSGLILFAGVAVLAILRRRR